MIQNAALIVRRKGIGALAAAGLFDVKGMLCRHILGRRFIRRRVRDFDMMLDLEDRGISRTLLLFGRREEEHVAILRRVLHEGMTVFDIGANIGYYALIESSLVGAGGCVLAIEPSPDNVKLLNRNLALNGCGNVQVLEMAVSDRGGRQSLHLSHQSNLNTFHPTGSALPHLSDRSVDVETDTVPAIARRVGIKPDLIRMDVEGHEVEVLRGLLPAIEAGEMAPMILFETHLSRYSPDHDLAAPLRALFAAGYRVPYLASTSEVGTTKIRERGYREGERLESDLIERVVFENVGADDAIDLICRAGGVRAVLLSR